VQEPELVADEAGLDEGGIDVQAGLDQPVADRELV
jgi:hypothetical protein